MFVFNLNDKVSIITNPPGLHHDQKALVGEVIGRAEYTNANDQYLVRYTDAQGNPQEEWWSDDALIIAKPRATATTESQIAG